MSFELYQELAVALGELETELKAVAEGNYGAPDWLVDGALDAIDSVSAARKEALKGKLSTAFPLTELFGVWGDIHGELDQTVERVDKLAAKVSYNKSINTEASYAGSD